MMEPLSVGVHSVSTLGKCKTDQNVIVFGAGPVGLLCMAVAKALGARRVIAVDIQKERLDFAKSYVATDVFMPVSLLLWKEREGDTEEGSEGR
jgi:L-iditol 2-dehydrogenase/D-xylulose reductase